MKKSLKLLVIVAAIAQLTACVAPRAGAGSGLLFTEVKEGQFVDNGVSGSKVGTACSTNILGLASTGDASIEAAKRDASIRSVATIDRTYYSILSVYGKSCTIVKGN